MLTHPDPQIQALFDDITEQRDMAMVRCANLKIELAKAQAELAALKAAAPAPMPADFHPGED